MQPERGQRNCGSNQKNVFLALVALTVTCTFLQYKFNYTSISKCLSDPKRYVATRVVERLYFEVPTSRAPSVAASTPWPASSHQSSPALSTTRRSLSCQSIDRVLFLKTHKTGGSTITNILNRYADYKNRTILIPRDPTYYSFFWPNKFRLNSVANLFGNKPDILANHARYSRKSMNYLFPKETTAYITILRHPVSQWESTFTYMSFPYLLGIHEIKDPIGFFLRNLPTHRNILELSRTYASLYLIRNPQLFDLGFDYKYFDNETMIRRAIKTIDNEFNLVLMMEHFDESLVLMKRRLCWEMDDIVYFKMNERLNKNKRRRLTEEENNIIKSWNGGDVALYQYFVEKFWEEVAKEGDGFREDLQDLRTRKEYYYRTCVEKESVEEAYNAVFVKGFTMRGNLTEKTNVFCSRMLRNELSYLDHFRSKRKRMFSKMESEHIENFDHHEDEANVTVPHFQRNEEDKTPWIYLKPTRRTPRKKHTDDEEDDEVAEEANDVILTPETSTEAPLGKEDDHHDEGSSSGSTPDLSSHSSEVRHDPGRKSISVPADQMSSIPSKRGKKTKKRRPRSNRPKTKHRPQKRKPAVSYNGPQTKNDQNLKKYDGKTIVATKSPAIH